MSEGNIFYSSLDDIWHIQIMLWPNIKIWPKNKPCVFQNGIVSEDQLTAQGIIFIIAGFETTANTLGSLSYQLVNNPEVS